MNELNLYTRLFDGQIFKLIEENVFASIGNDEELINEYNAWIELGNEPKYIPSPEESLNSDSAEL